MNASAKSESETVHSGSAYSYLLLLPDAAEAVAIFVRLRADEECIVPTLR